MLKRKAETQLRKPLPLDPHKAEQSRQAHLKQKAQLLERKSAKPNAEIIFQAKSLWNQLNRKKLEKAKRQEIVKELFNVVQGHVVDITFKHDASRVIQAAFKFGNEHERDIILSELKGRIVELSKSTYGKFLVLKMLSHGNASHRELILSELQGNVRKLIKHKEAAYVIEDAFREYTTSAQQEMLVSEMYGQEYSTFKISTPLEEICKGASRDTVMQNLWDSISSSIKKGSVGFTIIHRALRLYIAHANAAEMKEVIEAVLELLPEIVHTKDGAEVACKVIQKSTAKDRKLIMKSFREHLVKAMTDEYAHTAVIAMMCCVDDTVLLTKAYSPDINANMLLLLENKYGRRVLQSLLKETKMDKENSKKPDEVRRAEILASVKDTMIATTKENLIQMWRDPSATVLVDILLQSQELVDLLPYDDIMDHHPRLLKTLVQGGHYDKAAEKVNVVADLDMSRLKQVIADDPTWSERAPFVVRAFSN